MTNFSWPHGDPRRSTEIHESSYEHTSTSKLARGFTNESGASSDVPLQLPGCSFKFVVIFLFRGLPKIHEYPRRSTKVRTNPHTQNDCSVLLPASWMDTARTERPRKQAVVAVFIINEDPAGRSENTTDLTTPNELGSTRPIDVKLDS